MCIEEYNCMVSTLDKEIYHKRKVSIVAAIVESDMGAMLVGQHVLLFFVTFLISITYNNL